MLAKLQLLLLAICLSLDAFSAGEVLPHFESDQEQRSFMISTQRQIPFSSGDIESLFATQKKGLKVLRKEFPNYDKWMQEKPDPISITLFELEKQTSLASVLQGEPLENVKQFVADLYSSGSPFQIRMALGEEYERNELFDKESSEQDRALFRKFIEITAPQGGSKT